MASLVDTLRASEAGDSDGFLNDLVAQLWPNINVAGCRMVKEIVEPMFASMLPGPLASLHFTKLDLGPVPLKVSKVDVIRTENGGVSLGMDVSWHSKSDFQLDGQMVPELGIKGVHLTGRLSVLLAPLTNILPCFGAAQIAFVNPPKLELDFTGAADIADSSLIDKTVRKAIMDTICSMAVLPNRYLYKMDPNSDWFQTYLPHLGVLRLTVEKATGLESPKRSGGATGKIEGLLSKVGLKDVPDPFVNVSVGAEPAFRSKTKEDCMEPVWDETHDFLVADFDQNVVVEVMDEDPGENDPMGAATVSVRKLLLGGPQTQELPLVRKDRPDSNGRVAVRAKYFNFIGDANTLSAAQDAGEGDIVGLATVLIASVLNLQGNRDELKPNVKVAWGTDPKRVFNTTTQTYSPGMDIFNPSFDQGFRFPITKEMLANPPGFEITLMNGTDEKVGSVELPFEEVLNAEGCVKGGELDVGGGVQVRAQIFIRGLQPAK
ncbi:hypothetical protein N0V93_008958 [Gnomoniopsis smithogilvyi]|uniref:Uncharacterized protein n=1 Tax=Gnomoniopsis smithogilvyi TaxID=1191159 RepID=A0A9W9CSC8_9PEZI|nr:hypothetical protein N0V93_008958 [Gnomoniopsis smithogilvyi]